MIYVYVLKSLKSGRFYVGQTNNLVRRLDEHNSGHTKSLAEKGPFKFVYVEEFEDRILAVRRERFLKSGKGREERSQLGL